MTPERFRQINALADEALGLSGWERRAFLEKACSGDEELRRHIERIVAAHESSEDFLEIPALHLFSHEMAGDEEMDLKGRQIGRYEIVSRLGSGGHGEVWLARDTQLGREAALKFLQPEFSGNSGLARRFAYEARCSSALNHPNIVTIYEIGQAEGLDFIAQEFVHGETLRETLTRGALKPERAIHIVSQAAAALQAAHGAGLVHRDIKPENVMLRPDGLVKVVDFGLARFVSSSDDRDRPMTKPGAVMGTVRYMSPEQARGLEVDARSDIFSLGVVFYELITGIPPFTGATDADILAAILTSDPVLPSRVKPGLRRNFDAVVLRCLEKDRENRYASAEALRVDLNRLARMYETKVSRPLRRALAAVAAAALLAIVGYSLYRAGVAARAPSPFNSMSIGSLALSGEIRDAAVSADGAQVAFVRNEGDGESLWMRRLAAPGDTRILEPQPGVYFGLTFSPDGKFLYYLHRVARGTEELDRLPLKDPRAMRVAGDGIICAALSRDGKRVALIRLDTKHSETLLVVADSDGSAARTVTVLRRPQYLGEQGLAWSPDGSSIVCFGGNATYYTREAYRLLEFRLADGAEKAVRGGSWASTGSLLWTADGSNLIFAAGERPDGPLQVWMASYPAGRLRRITNDLSNYSRLTLTKDSKSLLAVRKETSAELWVTRGDPTRATQISSGNIHDWNAVAWTPLHKIVFSANAGDARNLWMIDADGRNLKQLTSGHDDRDEVEATRDGRYLLYQAQGKIWRANADGSGEIQLTHGVLDVHPTSSADSRWVVYTTFPAWSPGIGGRPRLSKVAIDGGDPIELTSEAVSMAQVSPDGKLIAGTWYGENDPRFTHSKLALLPFAGGPTIRLFERKPGDSAVEWSPDGKALDYVVTVNDVGNLWRQPIDSGAPRPVTRFDTDELFMLACSRSSGQFALVRGKSLSDVVVITKFL